MRSIIRAAFAALTAVALTTNAQSASAQNVGKALVYCPVGIDDGGCNTIVNALTPLYLGGVDRGWDGSGGTINLATNDLGVYSVFIVPSLADDATAAPYALLRDPQIAHRLHDVLLGRIALWSGTPDIGTTNRAEKDGLIRSLASWAASNFATVNGPGLVVLLDQSENAIQRYDWLQGLVGLNVLADTEVNAYSTVRTLDAAGESIVAPGGIATAYANMASFGFYLPNGAPGVALSAVGQTGTTAGGQVVLITSPGGNVGTAVIKTDKDDYAPGEIVTFMGTGFQPGEAVTITLHEDPQNHADVTINVVADGQGAFADSSWAPDVHDLDVRFIVTASGTAGSRAQTTFTDGIVLDADNDGSDNGGGATTLSIGSVGSTAGDVLVAQVAVLALATGDSICAPSGWVSAIRTNNGSTITQQIFYKVTTGPETGPYVFTFRQSNCSGSTLSKGAAGGLQIYSGVNTTSPLDGTPTGNSGSSNSPQAPTMTTTVNGAMILRFFAIADNEVFQTSGTNYQQPVGSPDRNVAAYDNVQATAGAAGTFNASLNSTETYVASTVALRNIPPTKLAYTNSAFSGGLGSCFGPIVVQAQDAGGTPRTVAAATTVSLVTDAPAIGTFHTNNTCTSGTITSVTISANQTNSSNFYYKPTTLSDAAHEVTASTLPAVGLGSVAQTHTIVPPTKLVFTAGPFTGGVGTCLGPFTIQAQDAGNTPRTVSASNVNLSLATDGSGTFHNDSDCTNAASTLVQLDAGETDSDDFYYKASQVGGGGHGLTVSFGGLTSASQSETIEMYGSITDNLSTIIVPAPAVNIGDIMIAQIVALNHDSDEGICAPAGSGWTAVRVDNEGSDVMQRIFWRHATSAAGVTNYTFNFIDDDDCTGSAEQVAAIGKILVYSGINTLTPIAAHDGDNDDQGDPEAPDELNPAGNPNARVLRFFAVDNDVVITPEAPTTSLYNFIENYPPSTHQDRSFAGAHQIVAAANANVGSIEGTVSGDNSWVAATIILRMAAVANQAPSFTKGTDRTVLEDAGAQSVPGWATNILAPEAGQTLTFNVTGNTNPSLFSAGPAVSSTGTLTFTPAANANGSATITIVLQDNGGTANGGVDTSAPQSFDINVTPVNDEPSFTKGPDQTINEDAGPQTVNPWATAILAGPPNESGQAVTLGITNNTNPGLFSAGPSVSSTGVLTFTPAANTSGVATITLLIRDDGGTANLGDDTSPTQQFTITVNAVNDVPSFIKGADQVISEDTGPHSVAGWATAISAGPNESGQTVTFTVTNDNNGLFSVQPAVSPTGTLTYTLTPHAFGNATVSVKIVDNLGAESLLQNFEIDVNPVNDVPSFAKGADQTVNEDAGPQTVNPWATALSVGPANEVGQTLSFNITNNTNPGLFLSGPSVSSTGVLTYTPAANTSGVATITLNIQDNGGSANGGVDTSPTQQFTITVTAVNDAPSFTKGLDQTVNEDTGPHSVSNWASAISAGPGETQNVSFTVTAADPSLFSVQPAVSATGTLTYTLSPDAFGTTNVDVYLTDDGSSTPPNVNQSATQTFSITINPVNDAPSFTKGADQTVNEDAGPQTVGGWATGISFGPGNEVGQTVQFIVSNGNPGLFSAQPAVSPTGTLTFTPAPNANGQATLTVTLQDNGGTANGGLNTSASETFTITVTAVNDAPSFTKGLDQTVNEDTGPHSVTNWASAISAGPGETQNVSFTVTAANPSLFSVQPAVSATGTLTYTLSPDAFGTTTVDIYLTDDGSSTPPNVNQSATQTFSITINPVNDEPSFTKGADQTVAEDAPSQTVTGWATGISFGPANEVGQTVQFIVSNGNPGLFSAQPAVSPIGTLTFTPAPNAHGQATVDVYIKDNGGTANGGDDTSPTQQFTITVTSVNDAPDLAAISNQTLPWGNQMSVTAVGSDPYDDPDDTPFVYSIVTAPTGVAINGSSGVITWTPTNLQIGASQQITVRVTDAGTPALSSDETFYVTVEKRDVALAYNGLTTQQYSDHIGASATLTDNDGGTLQGSAIVGATISFALGSQTPTSSGTTNASGVATSGTDAIKLSQSTVQIVSTFAQTAYYNGATDTDSYSITREDATIYNGTAGNVLINQNGTFTFEMRETNGSAATELNSDLTKVAAGDIALVLPTQLTITAKGVYNGGNSLTWTNATPCSVSSSGSGYTKVLTFTCQFNGTANPDTYEVDVTITSANNYYRGQGIGIIQVTDPNAGFATGGGWYWYDATKTEKVNFGFMAKATVNNKKTVFQGSLLVIRHKADGTIIRIKSNVFDGYSINLNGVSCANGAQATFSGKANYMVNGNSLGNLPFTGFAEDCGEPSTNDKFSLYHGYSPNEVSTATQLTGPTGLVAKAVTIVGGNVQVPKK